MAHDGTKTKKAALNRKNTSRPASTRYAAAGSVAQQRKQYGLAPMRNIHPTGTGHGGMTGTGLSAQGGSANLTSVPERKAALQADRDKKKADYEHTKILRKHHNRPNRAWGGLSRMNKRGDFQDKMFGRWDRYTKMTGKPHPRDTRTATADAKLRFAAQPKTAGEHFTEAGRKLKGATKVGAEVVGGAAKRYGKWWKKSMESALAPTEIDRKIDRVSTKLLKGAGNSLSPIRKPLKELGAGHAAKGVGAAAQAGAKKWKKNVAGLKPDEYEKRFPPFGRLKETLGSSRTKSMKKARIQEDKWKAYQKRRGLD